VIGSGALDYSAFRRERNLSLLPEVFQGVAIGWSSTAANQGIRVGDKVIYWLAFLHFAAWTASGFRVTAPEFVTRRPRRSGRSSDLPRGHVCDWRDDVVERVLQPRMRAFADNYGRADVTDRKVKAIIGSSAGLEPGTSMVCAFYVKVTHLISKTPPWRKSGPTGKNAARTVVRLTADTDQFDLESSTDCLSNWIVFAIPQHRKHMA